MKIQSRVRCFMNKSESRLSMEILVQLLWAVTDHAKRVKVNNMATLQNDWLSVSNKSTLRSGSSSSAGTHEIQAALDFVSRLIALSS
jgi:hypothetical protein